MIQHEADVIRVMPRGSGNLIKLLLGVMVLGVAATVGAANIADGRTGNVVTGVVFLVAGMLAVIAAMLWARLSSTNGVVEIDSHSLRIVRGSRVLQSIDREGIATVCLSTLSDPHRTINMVIPRNDYGEPLANWKVWYHTTPEDEAAGLRQPAAILVPLVPDPQHAPVSVRRGSMGTDDRRHGLPAKPGDLSQLANRRPRAMSNADHVVADSRFLGRSCRAQAYHCEGSADLTFDASPVLVELGGGREDLVVAVCHISS